MEIRLLMNRLFLLFSNLDSQSLKIMKYGVKICFLFIIVATLLLCNNLFFLHSIFFYSLGLFILKVSLYFIIEFIICGFVVDKIKKE